MSDTTKKLTRILSQLRRGRFGRSTNAFLEPAYPWYGGLLLCLLAVAFGGWWSYSTFEQYRTTNTIELSGNQVEDRLYRTAEVAVALEVIAARETALQARLSDSSSAPAVPQVPTESPATSTATGTPSSANDDPATTTATNTPVSIEVEPDLVSEPTSSAPLPQPADISPSATGF